MVDYRPTLTALLGSRLCHDLISPIGAIGNGMELLQLTGGTKGPEMALIEDSIATASAKLKFFRICYGVASPEQGVAGSEAAALVAHYYKDSRISVDWTAEGNLERSKLKMALLLILCLETSLPSGGKIKVSTSSDRWELQAIGSKLRFEAEVWDALGQEDCEANVSATSVNFALACETAKSLNLHPKATQGNGSIDVTF